MFFFLLSCLQDVTRTNVQSLLNLLTDEKGLKFRWIKARIVQMWPHWQTASSALKIKRDFSKTVKKKVNGFKPGYSQETCRNLAQALNDNSLFITETVMKIN